MFLICENREPNHLPDSVLRGHDLCFLIHDILTQLLASGEKQNVFETKIPFETEKQKESFEKTNDIFLWLETEKLYSQRVNVLRATVLPAVLSDMLHCIYETLESSRKAKLNISYMLVRKPIQESLYLLESIILNEHEFAETIVQNPLLLRPKNAGGVEGHRNRINKVLEIIGENNRLDASYIAQLRYDKNEYDSFDGVCNQAMHLFTEHKAIKTENLNINFIFSGWEQKTTQWEYLYSRLPYLLFYAYQVVEYIMSNIILTTQEYMDDMSRRISALIILWRSELNEDYVSDEIDFFVSSTADWLRCHCHQKENDCISVEQLVRMAQFGAYPNESEAAVEKRVNEYSQIIKFNEANNACNNKLGAIRVFRS